MWEIDDRVGKAIAEISIFQHIHPNLITACSFFLNAGIIYGITHNRSRILYVFVVLRILTDILDGNVARLYHKTTDLGGFLDTMGDAMLYGFTVPFLLAHIYECEWHSSILLGCLNFVLFMLYLDYKNALIRHTALKVYNNDSAAWYTNTIPFVVNNNLITVLPVLLFLVYLLDK